MANEKMRLNRTGASVAPSLFQEPRQLIAATSQTAPSTLGDEEETAQVRSAYAKAAEAPGNMPRATATRAKDALALNGGVVFLDKLGERLAFERAGVRLYDALLSKHDAWGSWLGGPRRADLEKLRSDEYDHFMMLQKVLGEFGADLAATTRAANRTSVASKDLPAALSDAHTNLRDGLEAILIAELVDNDCWEDLSDLASVLGRDDLSARFEEALGQERAHLSLVRRWLGAAIRGAVGAKADANNDGFERRTQAREKAASVQAGARGRAAAGKPHVSDGTQARKSGGTGGAGKTGSAGKRGNSKQSGPR